MRREIRCATDRAELPRRGVPLPSEWAVTPSMVEEPMEFRILGPLEVVSDDELVEVHGAKARALLALFLVHANQVVAPDRLIDDLWDGAPPNTARPTLQTYVSQVRKSLPRGSLNSSMRSSMHATAGPRSFPRACSCRSSR